MRTRFDEQLEKLNAGLLEMGEIIECAIKEATKALITKDVELAKQTIATDEDINNKEKELESLCLKIILQQQPVAGDLRLISSVLKMITDMERIGDHASDISELTLLLAEQPNIAELERIPKMAEATMQMVTDSINAFVQKDLELAQKVIVSDDIVDGLFLEVRKDLIELIKVNPENGDQIMDYTMIAKYFERIGDHATNIAEWVVFSITGVHKNYKIL